MIKSPFELLKERIRTLPQNSRVALYPKNKLSLQLQKHLKKQFKIDITAVPKIGYDAYVICENADKVVFLKKLAKLNWKHNFPKVITAGDQHSTINQRLVEKIEENNSINSYAVGYNFTKAHIYESLKQIRNLNVGGYIIELGSFNGGTLSLIEKLCSELKIANRIKLVGFDTWDNNFHRNHFLDMFDMKEYVSSNMDTAKKVVSKNTILIKGDIKDTLANWIKQIKKPILLAFIDTDNYFATAKSLPKIWNKLKIGGCVIFDHYYTKEEFYNTLGEHIAAKDFFENRKDCFNLTGTGVFLKLR